ncbi:MAG TPA: hypothetical protein VME22_15010 [Solirubrobacteraceae bacterium]|nr:hypothetical protein [Solirubrobacteraceae bacterium]
MSHLDRVPGEVDHTVDEIIAACKSMAGLPYDGEPVDQLEHALQCGALARGRSEDSEFVVACLLHDIARAAAVAGIPYDGPREHHGEAGARWLEPRVGTRVAWLAEQHVPAKRYLVATDPAHAAGLSEVSARTLVAQGGPISAPEVEAFESQPGLATRGDPSPDRRPGQDPRCGRAWPRRLPAGAPRRRRGSIGEVTAHPDDRRRGRDGGHGE